MRHSSRAMLLFAGAMLAASPVEGQQVQEPAQWGPQVVQLGIQGLYARPVGEFHDYVRHGGGLNLNVVFPLTTEGPVALRADGGFIVYGSETREVCFSTTVGCRVRLNLTTTNTIGYLNAGPQLMMPTGPVRPYVSGALGVSYFSTTSQLQGTGGSQEPFASSTNFDDFTFSWGGAGGLLIPVAHGRTPVAIDVGVRYHGNGQVEYLKKGDIEDRPDGSIVLHPTRSEGNLLTFQVGVSIGVRRQPR